MKKKKYNKQNKYSKDEHYKFCHVAINKKADVRLPTNEEEDKFISLVKDITSKGFVRSNLKEKLIDLSNVRINLKSKK